MGLKSVPALKGFQQFYPLYQDSLEKAGLKIRKNSWIWHRFYYPDKQ